MDDAIERHCRQIDRCNQRGGRMLSIVDLIEAGTFPRELAGYCLAAIGRRTSFMVGALPGGAGKTTVMGALLNFVPAEVELHAAHSLTAIERGIKDPSRRGCYICHEIGAGPYYAYLWGAALRAYFDLPAAGHMLATNLHADTFEQARAQIVHQNAVPEADFRRMKLVLFLSIRRDGAGLRRRIETVWESDGTGPHRQIYSAADPGPIASGIVAGAELHGAVRMIDELIRRRARTIEQVRAAVVSLRGGAG